MTRRAQLYYLLAAVGLISQLAIMAVFLADHGADLDEFAAQAVESTIAVLALADLLLCALAFLVWSRFEASRLQLDRWWPFALATAGGLCFALPLFLGYREQRLA